MRHFPWFIVLLCLFGLCIACHNEQTGTVVSDNTNKDVDKDAPYVEGNKKILQWENEEMQLFIKRYGWQMQRTGTGLYIQILDPGKGTYFQEGDRVTMDYQMFLLSGEKIYDAAESGPKVFTVAKSDELEALHEAAMMLKPGAKARLVIPSYLAYGVAGDGNKVNGRLSLAMTLTIDKHSPEY